MNARTAAALVAVLAVAVALVPVLGEDASADTDDGLISVSTIDGSDPSISVDSGGTGTVTLYVINNTENAVAFEVTSVNGFSSDLEATSSVVIVGTDSTVAVLTPNGTEGSVAIITLTIEADSYADSGTTSGTVTILARDLGSSSAETYDIPLSITVSSVFVSGDSYNKFFGLIPNELDEPLDSVWFTAAVTLIVWIIATVIVSEIVIPLLTRLVGNRKTEEEKKKLTKQLTTAITALMFVIAINECAQIVGASTEICYIISALSNIVYVGIGAGIAWIVYMFVVTAFLKGLDKGTGLDGVDMTLLPLFKMIGQLVISVVAICAILGAFGVDLYGMMVSAGVITLGITLGAQDVLEQFFAGIVLLATRPFKTGDFIQINGETYRVRKIKIMFTELDNWDFDQIVTMPNNAVSSATVVNLSVGRTRVYVYVDVAYGTDLDKAKASLESAGMKHPHVIKDGSCTPPNARITEFGDSGIQVRLACYVDDFNNSAHFAGQIRELVYKELNADGIEIPYSRIQVDVLTDPESRRRSEAAASAERLRNPQRGTPISPSDGREPADNAAAATIPIG